MPSTIFTIDLATGQQKLFRSLSPADPTSRFSKAADALQRPVKNDWKLDRTDFGCTVLVPRVLNQQFGL
jgi:hypothetical protein